jgi:hypothetical protein
VNKEASVSVDLAPNKCLAPREQQRISALKPSPATDRVIYPGKGPGLYSAPLPDLPPLRPAVLHPSPSRQKSRRRGEE